MDPIAGSTILEEPEPRRRTARKYPAKEYQQVEGAPLPVEKLARIWGQLSGGERSGFVLALDADARARVADLLIQARLQLPADRLAQIWAGLPEADRLGFLHSLDQNLTDDVMAACLKVTRPA